MRLGVILIQSHKPLQKIAFYIIIRPNRFLTAAISGDFFYQNERMSGSVPPLSK